jgi:circadian clock protein KaiB
MEELTAAASDQARAPYVLRLYVTGNTVRSQRAVANIRRICEEHLIGRYDLKIFDLLRQPALAAGEWIVAVPTLVLKQPLPERRFIGDLSQTDRLLDGLGVARPSVPRATAAGA